MRIGIFGGSFNPPHIGHLIIAETAREQTSLDRIYWVPAPVPPHKETGGLVSFEHRLTMTGLAVKDHPAFVSSDIEHHLPRPSYTLQTLEYLTNRQPQDSFHLIIGGDSLASFYEWHRPGEILKRVDLVVYHRPGADYSHLDSSLMDHVHQLSDTVLLPLSSTDVRNRLSSGQSIRYLVPESVRHYIQDNGLYIAGA